MYRAVNTIMVQTYWQIGKRILEQEQQGSSRAGYGDFIVSGLSKYLSDALGKGFSEANLWNMRQFYQVFPEFDQFSTQRVENSQSFRQGIANLSWTNIRLIMRIDDPSERDYYIKEATGQNWTSRVLERNIKSEYYRRLLSTQQAHALSDLEKYNPADFIKDPYIAEFLDVPEDLTGKEVIN